MYVVIPISFHLSMRKIALPPSSGIRNKLQVRGEKDNALKAGSS